MIGLLDILSEQRGKGNDANFDVITKGFLDLNAAWEALTDRPQIGLEKASLAFFGVQTLDESASPSRLDRARIFDERCSPAPCRQASSAKLPIVGQHFLADGS